MLPNGNRRMEGVKRICQYGGEQLIYVGNVNVSCAEEESVYMFVVVTDVGRIFRGAQIIGNYHNHNHSAHIGRADGPVVHF